jgi:hypothetical protein
MNAKGREYQLGKAERRYVPRLFFAVQELSGFWATVFRFQAKALEMTGVRLLTLAENCGQFMVGLGAKTANQVVHSFAAAGLKEFDGVQGLQPLQDMIESAVDVSHGAIHAGFDMLEISGVVVGARALGLRQVDGAFTFICSHVASY